MFYEGRGIQITALPTQRAACCSYEETESSRGSKSLPDLPQSSLTQELLVTAAAPQTRKEGSVVKA